MSTSSGSRDRSEEGPSGPPDASPPTSRPRRRRYRFAEAERQTIRRKHRQNPGWSQQHLAQWATQEFGRPVGQSLISNLLQPRYGDVYQYIVNEMPLSQQPTVSHEGVVSVTSPASGAGTNGDWIQRLEQRQALARASTSPTSAAVCPERHSPSQSVGDARIPTAVSSVCDQQEEIDLDARSEADEYGADTTGKQRQLSPNQDLQRRPSPVTAPKPSDMFLAQFFAGLVNNALSHSNRYTVDTTTNWFTAVVERVQSHPILQDALNSVLIRHAGIVTGDNHVSDSSRRFYGRALMGLQKAIDDAQGALLDLDLVSTTMLLASYEVFNYGHSDSSHDPFISHTHGTTRLMTLLGPRPFENDYGRKIILAFAGQLLYSIEDDGAKFFFDDNEWLPVVKHAREHETGRDCQELAAELYNLSFRVVHLRERWQLYSPATVPDHMKKDALSQLYQLRRDFFAWGVRCQALFPTNIELLPEGITVQTVAMDHLQLRLPYRPNSSRALTLWSASTAKLICTNNVIKMLDTTADFSGEDRLLRGELESATTFVPVLGFLARRKVFISDSRAGQDVELR